MSGPPSQAKRRVSRHGSAALLAMLAPAALFPLCLWLVSDRPRFAWLAAPADWPWELWAVGLCGSLATLGGVLDWRHHRSGHTSVGRAEHRAHVLALAAGGLPLFAFMCGASLSERPSLWLIPILIAVLWTTALICHDEFRFHRRCGAWETLTHRLLVFGNGLAWLAWTHWVFVRPSLVG